MSSSPVSKTQSRIGWAISAIMVLLLTMDAVVKFVNPPQVAEASSHLGLPPSETFTLGIILLACTILYAIPATCILGAILLTGYLGGAVQTHLRVADSLFDTLFGIILGIVIWAGVYLRDARLRSLIPFRTKGQTQA